MRNQAHRTDDRPIEPHCPCPACRRSRGYIRHLFMSKEMLGPILLSIHNLTYYQRLIADARQAITESRFGDFFRRRMHRWATGDRSAEIER